MDAPVKTAAAPLDELLQLADDALILGQRNAQWCGHGPVLEEDLSLTNMSLDLIGQARLLYQLAARRIESDDGLRARFSHLRGARDAGRVTEDTLAYFRETHEFFNHTLMELPHHGPLAGTAVAPRDWAVTITRNYLHSARMVPLWDALQSSLDTDLAAIAAKSLKEARYHLRHSHDWMLRLGDGTGESHARAQAALDHLMPYTQEFWVDSPAQTASREQGTGADTAAIRAAWHSLVDATLAEATLRRPDASGAVPRGKRGEHSEHLGFVLAEMQSLARAHPDASW